MGCRVFVVYASALFVALSQPASQPNGQGAVLGATVTLKGHTHTITCLAFAPKGNLLASGSKDATVRI